MIINEEKGLIKFDMIEEGVTYREELDEQTGFREIVITETKDKKKNPAILIVDKKGEVLKTYSLPVGAHLSVKEGDEAKEGERRGKRSEKARHFPLSAPFKFLQTTFERRERGERKGTRPPAPSIVTQSSTRECTTQPPPPPLSAAGCTHCMPRMKARSPSSGSSVRITSGHASSKRDA